MGETPGRERPPPGRDEASRPRASRRLAAAHVLLLVAACFAVYANGFGHAYNLDSSYGLVDNTYVRSLAYVPRYFVDPFTLTTVRMSADYRPLLQTTFALNHAISGYEMWSWHLVQIVLHACCVLAIYALARWFFEVIVPGDRGVLLANVSFAAALVHAVHPVNAGVVDYLWARSSLLVAALVLPSLVLYARDTREPRTWRLACVFVLYTLALFTKVEAVGALGAYALLEVLLQAYRRGAGQRASFLGDLRRSIGAASVRRLVPLVAVTLLYGGIRMAVVPDVHVEGRHAADATATSYLLTQFTAWWHYIIRWVAPLRLVADDLAYPTYRVPWEPVVLLAAAGWVAFALLLRAVYPRRPEPLILALMALALVSPTSSFMPLTEMVNEHRPYAAIAVLSLAIFVPGGLALHRASVPRSGYLWGSVALLGVVGVLSGLTWQRNKVFWSPGAYWKDVEDKAPSARSNVNYGLVLMRRGDLEAAAERFEAASKLAPRWHVLHLNLAILKERRGDTRGAFRHYDQAVAYDALSSDARVVRGHALLRHRRYGEALADLEASLGTTQDLFSLYVGLATASAGMGRSEQAARYTEQAYALDAGRTERSIEAIARPFSDDALRREAGLDFFAHLATRLPDRWWIHANRARLARALGDEELAERERARAAALRSP